MRNFVQSGVNLTLPAPYAVASGEPALIGSLFGIAAHAADIGEDTTFVMSGVFTLPKVSALAISIGDKVYWDSTNKLITKTASGNTLVGNAVTVAANPSASVNVLILGAG